MTEQNDNLATVAGIGPTITMKLGGKEYTLGPVKIKYLALVQERAALNTRKKTLAGLEVLREAGDLLESSERADLIKDMNNVESSYIDELMTPQGLQYILYLRLNANHPELTEEEVGDLVTMDAISELRMELANLVGIDVFVGTEGSDSPPEPGAAL